MAPTHTSQNNQAYTDALKRASPPPDAPTTPLFTFLGFLLQTCERDAGDLYQGLLKVYRPYLDVEPAFGPVRGYLSGMGVCGGMGGW